MIPIVRCGNSDGDEIDFTTNVRQEMRRGGNLVVKSDPGNWGGHHIQLVWFLANADAVNAADLFKRVWGFDADQVQQNRIPTPANPFLGVASAQKDGRSLQIQVQPGRADLVLSAQNPDEPNSGFGNLFDLEKTLVGLLDQIEKSGQVEQDAFRLSIIATLLKPVPNYREGASEFYKALGFDPKIKDSTDLNFQINSRTKIEDVSANRLFHISVLGFQLLSMSLAFGQAAGVLQPNRTATMQYAARRHFDFNTVPDGKLLELERQISIFRGLAAEILRVAASGKVTGLRS